METNAAGGPSKDDVQDMELKILQGNNGADASQKAADDDFFNEVLAKHAQKDSSGNDVLRMDEAKEAAEEVIERSESDPMKAQERTNEIFPKMWKDHAINGAMMIDQSEAYQLL